MKIRPLQCVASVSTCTSMSFKLAFQSLWYWKIEWSRILGENIFMVFMEKKKLDSVTLFLILTRASPYAFLSLIVIVHLGRIFKDGLRGCEIIRIKISIDILYTGIIAGNSCIIPIELERERWWIFELNLWKTIIKISIGNKITTVISNLIRSASRQFSVKANLAPCNT